MNLGKLLVLVVVTLGMVALSASYGFTQEQEASAPGIASQGATYTLGIDDIIQITVRNQEEFSGQFAVGPDGKVQYNFVGDIQAEGLTKDELREVLIKKLEKFIKVPEVSITILAYRSKFVYILGEVRAPGKYPMKGDVVSLRETLVSAGLPTPAAALRRTYVITPDEVKPTNRKVDIYKLLYKGLLKDDIELVPGDLVVVPSTIPSEINRALTTLLSPFSKAASTAAVYQTLTE